MVSQNEIRLGIVSCGGAYTNYEEMIRTEDLDGILLATWPSQHREQIEKCLAAGARNILCEKALTLTGKEAAEIWELVTAADAFLMEGFMYRHHPCRYKGSFRSPACATSLYVYRCV